MKNVLIVIIVGLVVLIGIAIIVSLFADFSNFRFEMPGFSGRIAVIPIKGDIVADSTSFSAEMSALEVVQSIEMAEEDPSIGAILLEINSPGGSVVAARQITEKIKEARKSKKVVAWISEEGASAAYYIAASADYVVADADSITGSIGVISILPNIEKFLEKWGISVKVLTEGEHKDMGSIFSGMSKEDERILQKIMHDAFVRFKNEILQFREGKINAVRFEEIADGRILSGEQALKVGLVDELGTREKAIQAAASLAGISEPQEVNLGKPQPSLLDMFSLTGYKLGQGFKQGFLQSKASVQS